MLRGRKTKRIAIFMAVMLGTSTVLMDIAMAKDTYTPWHETSDKQHPAFKALYEWTFSSDCENQISTLYTDEHWVATGLTDEFTPISGISDYSGRTAYGFANVFWSSSSMGTPKTAGVSVNGSGVTVNIDFSNLTDKYYVCIANHGKR